MKLGNRISKDGFTLEKSSDKIKTLKSLFTTHYMPFDQINHYLLEFAQLIWSCKCLNFLFLDNFGNFFIYAGLKET